MPVRISLRTGKDYAPYRHMLFDLIQSINGGKLILCSGYIWEPNNPNEGILSDGLFSAIKYAQPDEIVLVAGKFRHYWLAYYKNFVKRLSQTFCVKPYIARKKNWHAKMALRIENDTTFAALIGSSNLTLPAFKKLYSRWNFEGDVLIWLDRDRYNNRFFHSDGLAERRDSRKGYGTFFLELSNRVQQPTEEEQLQKIYDLVMGSELGRLGV